MVKGDNEISHLNHSVTGAAVLEFKVYDLDLKVVEVGHDGTAKNFKPISNNRQSIK